MIKYIFAFVLFVAFLFILNMGMNKNEVVECLKWQNQASEYPSFYLLQWQRDQCEAHNISIDAIIK